MKFIGFDTETYMIQHSVVPPLVCLTMFDEETQETSIFGKDDAAAEFHKVLDRVLSRDDLVLAAQNASFDTCVLSAHDPSLIPRITEAYKRRKIVCTKLAEILLNSADPKTAGRPSVQRFLRLPGGQAAFGLATSLAGLVIYYLREDITASKQDSRRTSYADLVDIPVELWAEEDRDYAIKDAVCVVKVLREQLRRQQTLGGYLVLNDLPRQSYVEFVLQFQASVIGVAIDPDKIIEASDELMAEQDSSVGSALSLGLLAPDKKKYRGYSKSTKVMQTILSDIERIVGVTLERTETGKYKGGEQELKQIYEYMDYALAREVNFASKLPIPQEDLSRLNEYSEGLHAYTAAEKAWKAKHTFVDALAQAALNSDHRIRFGYQGLKETGRTSSRNPNMQNLPRGGKTRSCLVPRAGHIFLQADYSNAELRTLAQVHLDEGRYSKLAVEYQKDPNFDPHLFAALEMLKLQGVEMTYAEGKAALKNDKHPHYGNLKQKRQFAKVANFGYAGGLGATKFTTYAAGQGLKLSVQEAKDLKESWLNVWTEMREYFDVRANLTEACSGLSDREIEQEARDAYSPVHSSRFLFRRSNRARFLRNFTIACNTPFQGIAADGAKDSLIAIHEACFFDKTSPLYRSIPIMFVHDEVVLETPFAEDTPEWRAKATAAAMELKRLMEQGMLNHTPDIPAVAEPCLAVCWTKNMESRNREDGTLTIYGLD